MGIISTLKTGFNKTRYNKNWSVYKTNKLMYGVVTKN